MPRAATASIDQDDVARFSAQAADWWNPEGSFRPLHRLNPVRLQYVRDQICQHFNRNAAQRPSLQKLKVLDVGCGGGLLAEPLARLGAEVMGLDASAAAIAVARKHAAQEGLSISYRAGSVEALAADKKRFDVITALEIVEHVADMESFLSALSLLLKPGGLLIMSTLNRTPHSFLLGIVAAEYVLGWVPKGTHEWRKFIRPAELVRQLSAQSIVTTNLTGLVFNPLRGEFQLIDGNLKVNYLLTAHKPA